MTELVDEDTTAEDMGEERKISFFDGSLVLFGFNAWRVSDDGDDPQHIYLLDRSGNLPTAMHVSYDYVGGDGDDVHYEVIIHRLTGYASSADSPTSRIENGLAMVELHELSHWATSADYECSDDHSDRWNPILTDVVAYITGRDLFYRDGDG